MSGNGTAKPMTIVLGGDDAGLGYRAAIKADLENVTDLQPASDDFEFFFRVGFSRVLRHL